MSLKALQTLWDRSVETQREFPAVIIPYMFPEQPECSLKVHKQRPPTLHIVTNSGMFWGRYKAPSSTPAVTFSEHTGNVQFLAVMAS